MSREDLADYEFLRRLDGADLEVTDWEAEFIGDLLAHERPLTAAQRAKVEELRKDYGADI
jgi:hypothetical protein